MNITQHCYNITNITTLAIIRVYLAQFITHGGPELSQLRLMVV